MSRKLRTQAKLLSVAERLFARQGIEGTSLREIASAAGMANNSAVQYHFGTKEALVERLFLDRMLKLEPMREAMLERARRRNETNDLRVLLEIVCRPHRELVDDEGRHSYAEFLAQYLLRYRPPLGALANPPEPQGPANLMTVQRLIMMQLSDLPAQIVARRLVIGVLGYVATLTNHKSLQPKIGEGEAIEEALADTLDQLAVAIALPVRARSSIDER